MFGSVGEGGGGFVHGGCRRTQSKHRQSRAARDGIRFLKNRIYPVLRARLCEKSVLKPKKRRFTLRKYENRPFRAKLQIFGNSVFSKPTIRPNPRGGGEGGGVMWLEVLMITMFRYLGGWEGKAKGRGQDTHTQTHHCFRTNDQDGQCFLSSLSSTKWNGMTAFIRKGGMVSHSFSCSAHCAHLFVFLCMWLI